MGGERNCTMWGRDCGADCTLWGKKHPRDCSVKGGRAWGRLHGAGEVSECEGDCTAAKELWHLWPQLRAEVGARAGAKAVV